MCLCGFVYAYVSVCLCACVCVRTLTYNSKTPLRLPSLSLPDKADTTAHIHARLPRQDGRALQFLQSRSGQQVQQTPRGVFALDRAASRGRRGTHLQRSIMHHDKNKHIIHQYTHIHTYIHVCVCVCVCVCVYVCTYTYVYKHRIMHQDPET
jgi:hypothetical protein